MALKIYFPVILQQASQFLLYDGGALQAGTYGLPINTRIYSYHPAATNDALTLLTAALGSYKTFAAENDRQISINNDDPTYTLRLVNSTDGLKLARLLGLYKDGPPLDLTYYQTHDITALDPCGVTLQSLFPGQVGYVHETYDLSGAPDYPAIHVVSDTGAAAQISGDARKLLALSLRAIPGAFFSTSDLGSFSATFSATFWQAYNPVYSAPYVLIVEDDKAWEYALRRPIQAGDARSTREDWHGHFNLELELQLVGGLGGTMIHFLINGFPYYFSDTATALSGATATLRPWIVGGADLVRAIRHSIEPWGGVVKSGEINVVIADADMSLSRILPIYPDPAPVRCLEYMLVPAASGGVQVDVSDNSDLSIGDILQCPYDAWEITAVGPVELPTGINCDRGIYSCFPGSTWIYQPYYQRGSGQSELFSFGRGKVPEIDGRTCTLWVDGALAWIGVVSAPRQQGPKWTFRLRHILDAWQDRFGEEGLPSFALNHDAYNGGGQWWQGNLVPPDSSGGLPAVGAIPAPYYPQNYGWTTDDNRGLSYLGTGEPTVAETLWNRATLAALGDSVACDSAIGRYVTKITGTPKYGWIDDPAMPVGILGALHASLIGQWLDCPDGLAESVRKQILSVSVANGTITLDQFTTNENGEWINGFAGFSSMGPISFRAAPVVSAPSIPILFYGLLTSTGSGDNGDHDLFPGYLGLGLPAELLDDRISHLLYGSQMTAADLGKANLSEELEAAGCWLVWRDGQFAIQEAAAPTTQASSETVDGDLLATDSAPDVDRASVAPVLCVVYKDAKENSTTINVRTPQIFRPTAGASKELSSKIRVGLPDTGLSGTLASIAYWLSRYAPRMVVPLIPGHGLTLGQVVTLESPFVAGAGDAYGASVAALVVGVSEVDAELLLNTQPSPGRILAPALRVLEWTGAVLTVAGGALEWLSLGGLDDDLALHDETTGEVQVVTLVSVDTDEQVTISAAPTHTVGDAVVLTLMVYDSDLVANRDRYCYLADASEELDTEAPHEYVF